MLAQPGLSKSVPGRPAPHQRSNSSRLFSIAGRAIPDQPGHAQAVEAILRLASPQSRIARVLQVELARRQQAEGRVNLPAAGIALDGTRYRRPGIGVVTPHTNEAVAQLTEPGCRMVRGTSLLHRLRGRTRQVLDASEPAKFRGSTRSPGTSGIPAEPGTQTWPHLGQQPACPC